MRGAGLAARAGDDQHAAVVALVRVRRARLDQRAHVLARQQLEPRPVELIDDVRRNADVGDHDVARRPARPAAAPAAASARPSVTVMSASNDRRSGRVSADRPDGKIDRHDRDAGEALMSATTVSSRPASARLEAGAEDRVDDQIVGRVISDACSSHALLVGDFDDGQPEPAEDFEIDARVAVDVGSGADDETETSTPRCCSVRATTKPSPPLLPVPHSTDDAAVGEVVDRATRSPPPPGGRRSPSAPATAMPMSSIVWRSASRICAAFRTRIGRMGASLATVCGGPGTTRRPPSAGRRTSDCDRRTGCRCGRRSARTCRRCTHGSGYAACSREYGCDHVVGRDRRRGVRRVLQHVVLRRRPCPSRRPRSPARIAIIASQKRSSSAFGSLSVGSIISVPGTGNDTVGAWKP